MSSKITLIYDGKCPFCDKFAELIELKSGLPGIQIKDARDNPPEIPNGYDMDVKGALLLKNGDILNGAQAVNWICNEIKAPSGPLLKILITIFSSKQRSIIIFPLLIIARRLALFVKGVPRKLNM